MINESKRTPPELDAYAELLQAAKCARNFLEQQEIPNTWKLLKLIQQAIAKAEGK